MKTVRIESVGTGWKTRRRGRAFAIACLAPLVVLSACTSSSPSLVTTAGQGYPTPQTAVLPSEQVAIYLEDPRGYPWFAQSRRDESVSATWRQPITSASQWPVPPRPAERRVRFYWWVQR